MKILKVFSKHIPFWIKLLHYIVKYIVQAKRWYVHLENYIVLNLFIINHIASQNKLFHYIVKYCEIKCNGFILKCLDFLTFGNLHKSCVILRIYKIIFSKMKSRKNISSSSVFPEIEILFSTLMILINEWTI